MGALIPSVYTDYTALRSNGIDNYAWINNPAWKTDMAGAINFRFRLPVLLGVNTTAPIATMNVVDAGSNASLLITARNHPGYFADVTRLDVLYRTTNGGTAYAKSGTTNLVANTWYTATITSTGKIYLNATEESYTTWGGFASWGSGWWGNIVGTNRNTAFAAIRRGGSVLNYGRVDLNNIRMLNAVPSGAEVTELYNAGDPRLLTPTLRAKVTFAYDFERRLSPLMGSLTETLTGVNIVGADYITP